MKYILVAEVLSLVLFWVYTFGLYFITQDDILYNVLIGATMSICSFGSGFILYGIWKEWKSLK